MRNARTTITGGFILTGLVLGGCTPPDKKATNGGPPLRRATAALAAKDYPAVVRAADEQVAAQGNSPKSLAQAYYLKGQAIEARPKATPSAATSDLAAARTLYEQALAQKPAEAMEATLRSAIANVAYFQDDFVTALGNWNAAAKNLPDPDSRAWAMYRIGLCQQRLGRFDQANKTFEQVQRTYPKTEQARRAKEHAGTNAFRVQVATLGRPEAIERLVRDLRAKGLATSKRTDMQGRTVVAIPDLPSYQAAKEARAKVLGDYPDALILP
jgi:tetratricopeptide (TPR) repeat protein